MRSETNILWTGGWDSTYRVLYLAMIEKKIVRPHYILDPKRKSGQRELQAISEIKQALRRIDEEAYGRVQKTNITPIAEIPECPDITAAYRKLTEHAPLGGQYDWLARYVRGEGLTHIEMCVELSEKSKAYHFLKGHLTTTRNGTFGLKGNADDNLKIFSCYEFPVIDLTKLEMKARAIQYGFIDALEKSWFCFNPIHGTPCGRCNPCISTFADGMGYRFPKQSIRRYKMRYVRKTLEAPIRIARQLKQRWQRSELK